MHTMVMENEGKITINIIAAEYKTLDFPFFLDKIYSVITLTNKIAITHAMKNDKN